MPQSFTLDGKKFAIRDGTRWRRYRLPGFPEVVRDNAQVERKDFLIYQQITLTGPLGIGQRQGNRLDRCFDQYNVNAMWPGILTRGPQKQTTTMTGFPATFKILGFFEGIDLLFVFGECATGEEPIWYWDGATETWANATLNGDVGADVIRIVGMCQVGQAIYAIADRLASNGSWDRITYTSTDGTTWTEVHTSASNETIDGSSDTDNRLFGLVPKSSDQIAAAYWASGAGAAEAEGTLTWMHTNTLGDAEVWSDPVVASKPVEDATEPRGFGILRGVNGETGYFIGTRKSIWFVGELKEGDSSIHHRLAIMQNQGSSYSGKGVAVKGGNELLFADGPRVRRIRWVNSDGLWEVTDALPSIAFPADAQGDVTAFTLSRTNPRWLYFAKSGTAASRNARIYLYDLDSDPRDPAVYCIYRNSTAQRAITQIYESQEDDGVVRLMIAEEQAAGGDQDIFFFENPLEHQLENSSYPYAASGTILDSERKPLAGLSPVSWRGIQVDADNLATAVADTQKVSIKDGQDGTAPANSQTIYSDTDPAQVWPDKTDGSAGVGVQAKRQQIEVTLTGTAGATPGPTIKEVTITYQVKGLLPDGTTPEIFEFEVDLVESVKMGGTTFGTVKDVLTALQSIQDDGELVRLDLDEGEQIYVDAELASGALNQQPHAAASHSSAGGSVLVRCRQGR